MEAQRINISGITVTNVYISPKRGVISSSLHALLDGCTTSSVALGDFNARHPLWGNESSNTMGCRLHSAVESINLVMTNTNIVTRCHLSGNTTGSIDLTITSVDFAHRLDIKVTDRLLGSDHFLIPISMDYLARKTSYHITSWSWNRATWEKIYANHNRRNHRISIH